VHAELAGTSACIIDATRGLVTRDPRQIVLEHPRLVRGAGVLEANQATLVLGHDNNVERVIAKDNVNIEAKLEPKANSRAGKQRSAKVASAVATDFPPDHLPTREMRARADQADLVLTGKQSLLRTATLTGNVHIEQIGFQPLQGDAGRAVLDFSGKNQLQKVHAEEGVRMAQQGASGTTRNANARTPQDFELTAPAMDFLVVQGRRLERAVTSGPSQIIIASAQPSGTDKSPTPEKTIVSAGKFEARFQPISAGSSRLVSIHGAPDAKIVNTAPG